MQPSWNMPAILDIRSRKIKMQILYSEKYMFWHQDHSNRTIIWGFIQKRIVWYPKWRPSWKMAVILIFWSAKVFFSKKVSLREYSCQFLYGFEKFPRKNPTYSCPTMHCRSPRIFTMFRLLCKYHFESMTVYPSCWSTGCTNPWRMHPSC